MDEGWCEGTVHGNRGLFPDNFVKKRQPGHTTAPTTAAALPSTPLDQPASSGAILRGLYVCMSVCLSVRTYNLQVMQCHLYPICHNIGSSGAFGLPLFFNEISLINSVLYNKLGRSPKLPQLDHQDC